MNKDTNGLDQYDSVPSPSSASEEELKRQQGLEAVDISPQVAEIIDEGNPFEGENREAAWARMAVESRDSTELAYLIVEREQLEFKRHLPGHDKVKIEEGLREIDQKIIAKKHELESRTQG